MATGARGVPLHISSGSARHVGRSPTYLGPRPAWLDRPLTPQTGSSAASRAPALPPRACGVPAVARALHARLARRRFRRDGGNRRHSRPIRKHVLFVAGGAASYPRGCQPRTAWLSSAPLKAKRTARETTREKRDDRRRMKRRRGDGRQRVGDHHDAARARIATRKRFSGARAGSETLTMVERMGKHLPVVAPRRRYEPRRQTTAAPLTRWNATVTSPRYYRPDPIRRATPAPPRPGQRPLSSLSPPPSLSTRIKQPVWCDSKLSGTCRRHPYSARRRAARDRAAARAVQSQRPRFEPRPNFMLNIQSQLSDALGFSAAAAHLARG